MKGTYTIRTKDEEIIISNTITSTGIAKYLAGITHSAHFFQLIRVYYNDSLSYEDFTIQNFNLEDTGSIKSTVVLGTSSLSEETLTKIEVLDQFGNIFSSVPITPHFVKYLGATLFIEYKLNLY